ncbi:Adenine DNA glycosylase [Rubrivivax sp. A210]|uniref:A/G-specific adenine glycosylase n=1 Tax=Rubrivivax sp. A210 TaxID=2772301 RepID=UPI0019196787|nr:A/G-specific adenine glycosylase [Rubrivivax sp. A210]CAD5372123.1 Adenine DNA glycosylase [Rubrivivax sp. A210]
MSRASAPHRAPDIATRVVAWQRHHGRHDLPWQGTRDPFRVWLSEVMLQQTQVATVRSYYARFLQRFPDVRALAAAPLDEVLALWSGLGYYSRARNLHRCAQVVVAEHGGAFPATRDGLAQLPGIGESTAAAIAAFCFDERVAILDGNVKRVLARALGFEGDLASAVEQRRLWDRAQALLPPAPQMVAYTQGLMDLGASVCSARRPDCERCPLAADCVAHASGSPERLPLKSRRLKRGQRRHALLWLRRGGRVWLVQRPAPGVWAGLWSLPQYESSEALAAAVAGWPGQGEWLPELQHALTHFDWTLAPLQWQWPARAAAPAALGDGRWVTRDEALALGLAAPIRRLLESAAD